MLLLDTQNVIQADATGIFLLALLIAPFVIPAIVKKAKISEAEDIKNSNPDGFKRVMGYHSYIDYQNAKIIVEKRHLIVSAQREYEEERRKAAEERQLRDKVNELRRSCPYATNGKSDEYIINNESSIRQEEKRHAERESRAKSILKDNPLGAREICGYISSWGMSDEDISKLINNESAIRNKQKECEANEAELKLLAPQFNTLKDKYPLGVSAICAENKWSKSNAEHVRLLLSMPGLIAEKQEQREGLLLNNKARIDTIAKRAKELISSGSKDQARNFVSLNYGEKVAKRVMDIIDAEEEFKALSKHLDTVARYQDTFAQETRNIIPDVFNGWGWYKYRFGMQYVDDSLNEKSTTMTVWQTFSEACCFDDTVSYEYYPSFRNNRISKSQLEGTYRYNEKTWDRVMSFISKMKDKYGEEIFVVLANTDHLNEHAFDNNFNYFIEQLKKAGIKYGETMLTDKAESQNRKYIVVDIITENANLKQYCESLFHYRHIMQIQSNKGMTGVVFITMLKCYDGAEIEDLNKRKIKEREDAIRKAKEEEERQEKERKDISEAKSIASSFPIGFKRFFPNTSSYSIDATQARTIILKKSSIRDYEDTLSRLRNSVSNWDTVRGVPHYFFYYYYPTRFTNVSADSQEARRLVYNFKDGIAHSKVKDLVVGKIRSTFSSNDISKMCFACIPASTRSVNQSRYEDFSREVSQALGMANAYNYITITREKTPSHLGGTDNAEYSYDKSFFNGKMVVLFDDIVTRGDSVSSMKYELEALGAVVICAISIGRTYSDWNGNAPKPHPLTGRV